MPLDLPAVRDRLRTFNFASLFTHELGWDFPANPRTPLTVTVKEQPFELQSIAQKRGVHVYLYHPTVGDVSPDYPTRRAIHKEVRKSAYEHLIIFVDAHKTTQTWQWVAYRPGQPPAYRETSYTPATQSGDALIQKLATISVPISEEEAIDLTGAVQKLRDAFNRETVTKKFYERFKTEHAAFLKFIKGIKEESDIQWYTSLMLNRLMFVYFIQKKGFLDRDDNYLRTRMAMVRELRGENKFLSFYRYFLTRLFHDGLGKHEQERRLEPKLQKLLGRVPYLNGGFFEVHQIEERNPKIDIPDEAFVRLFDFFEEFSWHLDDRPLRKDNEINPDVVGYIFEKYINQKQMGAYYTKEDITEYISKNTIIPFLFDAARKDCATPFQPGGSIWTLLSDNPDRYIYSAVRHGVIDEQGNVMALPKEVAVGIKKVEKRDKWNRPATQPFALPTETWREHVARRQRCLELREKLKTGEVTEINELITLNLDIWQFARDVLVNCESPQLLRAFWHAIQKLTVLDPTCGSGAFLFAALNILETLYSDCLEAMARFVAAEPNPSTNGTNQRFPEEVAEVEAGVSRRPRKAKTFERLSDFKSALSQFSDHRGQKYFILKSIIINNLYGVDIMEEAVEICKLRLFLKLVAQVEPADQIEPLPDIDFNIRAGNTLVGYVSLDEVRSARAMESAGSGKQKLLMDHDADAEIRQIEEDALVVQRAFEHFRKQQTKHGGVVTAEDKAELRLRLANLDNVLDRYLAADYGVDRKGNNNAEFLKWKASHQPFHWFLGFLGCMSLGGFDVVIGNPPYIELKEITGYKPQGYACLAAGNLYAVVMERSLNLCISKSRLGFIVPVSSVSTDRYVSLQKLLRRRSDFYSSFDDRPSRLFDGLEHIRLTIHVLGVDLKTQPTDFHSTKYNKWSARERPTLFSMLHYTKTSPRLVEGSLPKLSDPKELSILQRLTDQNARLSKFYASGSTSKHRIYYSRKVGYFLQVLDFFPQVLDGSGQLRPPSEFKTLYFESEGHAKLALCCLNSSLFYWFVTVFSDCRHVNKREVDAFPVALDALASGPLQQELTALASKLMKDLDRTSEERHMKFKHDSLRVQCILPKRSKPLLDEIDVELAKHYGFNRDEVDFILNYDAKYRLGSSIDIGDDE